MGCDKQFSDLIPPKDVSIHAPAWGATYVKRRLCRNLRFQSTHPHGVRQTDYVFQTNTMGFNPRTRMGCDFDKIRNRVNMVSFNPRTRMGCDCFRRYLILNQGGFNPRTRMGCDFVYLPAYFARRFQSTHPHGVRPVKALIYHTSSMFQSTHPHGVRHRSGSMNPDCKMFQSTHPHGVRLFLHNSFKMLPYVSIHAPAWGATVAATMLRTLAMFQSTHPHGVRQNRTLPIYVSQRFQSTHPHGVRLGNKTNRINLDFLFQSTHPHGVRLYEHSLLSLH